MSTTRVAGFDVLEELGRGAQSVVYRAVREGREFALKLTLERDAERQAAARLHRLREAAALGRVSHPALPKVFAVGQFEQSIYLVTELVRGRLLSAHLTGHPLAEGTVIAIGRTVASALEELHRRDLIHRDIKPENLMVDESWNTKLIDLGFVRRTGLQPEREGEVVGTMSYAAPEQTGMLPHPVDPRSDLYALGGVLFHLATGRPVFESHDPVELMQLHATTPPRNPCELNPALSPRLGAIITRLLAKQPGDRFPSAESLERELAALSGGSPPRALPPPMPLVGREGELEALTSALQRAATGKLTVAIVEGPPGTGKSRLLQALHGHKTGFPLIFARCLPGERVPFGALRAALDDHLEKLTQLAEPARAAALERVRDASARHAGILRLLSEELGALHPEAPRGSPTKDQLNRAMADFLGQLASACKGLVLSFDDAQWLDDGTAEVLRQVNLSGSPAPLLIALGGRSESDGPRTLERVADDAKANLTEHLVLGGLNPAGIAALVFHELGGVREVDPAFTERVRAQSEGLPLLALEYVRSALDAGLLSPDGNRWRADTDGLLRLQVPGTLAQLSLRRFERLGGKARELLAIAAVAGMRFGGQEVASLSASGVEGVEAELNDAARAGLVERQGIGRWSFVSELVWQHAYAAVPEAERQRLHAAAAELIAATASAEVYAIAHHEGRAGPFRPVEKVIASHLAAGRAALDKFDTPKALEWLSVAERLAAGSQTPMPELWEALGEVTLRSGRPAEAVAHFERAIKEGAGAPDRARLRGQLARVFVSQYEPARAVEEIERGFAEVGASLPRAEVPSPSAGSTPVGPLEPAPSPPNPERRVLIQLYDSLTMAAYMNVDPELSARSSYQAHAEAQHFGPSRQLVQSYINLVFAMGVLGRASEADRCAAEAARIADQLGDPFLAAKAEAYGGMAAMFYGDDKVAEKRLRTLLDRSKRWLDADTFVLSNGTLGSSMMFRGYAKEAYEAIDAVAVRLRQAHRGSAGDHVLLSYGGSALALLGRFSEARDWLERANKATNPKDTYYRGNCLNNWVLYHLEAQSPQEALEEAISARRALPLPPPERSLHYSRFFYAYQAYARIAQAQSAPQGERVSARQRAVDAVDELRRAAHIPTLRCHLLACEGALHALHKEHQKAEVVLAEAEGAAREAEHPWGLYQSHVYRAFLAREQGELRTCAREVRLAQALCVEQEWLERERQLARRFELPSLAPAATAAALKPSGGAAEKTSDAGLLGAVLQLNLAAATVFNSDQHARVCLKEVVRIMGADRSALLLEDAQQGRLIHKYGCDAEGRELEALSGHSSTVVETVRRTRKGLVVSGTEEGALLGSRSAVVHNLRSIMAAPLIIRDELLGVVYCDSRVTRGLFGPSDLTILLALANSMAISMETSRGHQRELERAALEQELRLTAAVQSLLLPQAPTGQWGRISVSGSYRPAAQCSGDWWWYDVRPDGSVVILVGDVTGHGAASAMTATSMATAYRLLSRGLSSRLYDVLTAMNEQLVSMGGSHFMSLMALELSPEGHLRGWSAGAPPVLIVDGNEKVRTLGAVGGILGRPFHPAELDDTLKPGTRMIVFTDGLSELQLPGKRQLGLKRLAELVRKTKELPLSEASTSILGEVDSARRNEPIADDLTFVLADFA
jgi:serine phosphatase RsbU (regulator of sigma subunit)/tetratricopeptide (TPR) repeat protein/tRNA A-37 threonylcarbamoyl transferase component Bud32